MHSLATGSPSVRYPTAQSELLNTGTPNIKTSGEPGVHTKSPLTCTPRSGDLSRLADDLLKDIDAQMRALPPERQAALKSSFDALVDASIVLAGRDNAGSVLEPQDRKSILDAISALKRDMKTRAPVTHKGSSPSSDPQSKRIELMLKQLAQHLERELRAMLRESAHPLVVPEPEQSAGDVNFGLLKEYLNPLPSGAQSPAKPLITQITEARVLLHQLSGEAVWDNWMTPCRNPEEVNRLRGMHEQLSQCLSQMKAFKDYSCIDESLHEPIKNFIQLVEHRERHLQLHLDVNDDYQSPDSIANICSARQLEIDAAIKVLTSQHNASDHQSLIRALTARRDRLERLKIAPGDADASRLLGKKAISGFARLLHPVDAARQSVKLEKAGERVLLSAAKGMTGRGNRSLELDAFSEPMLMEWLLKKAGVPEAGKALRAAHRRVLDSRPFDVIRSDIVVPMPENKAPQALTATTTPASHVLCDASRIRFADNNAVLNPENVNQYLHQDDTGTSIHGGFNSHDTAEHLHPTLAAHDNLTMQGQTLFGATRHGVTAPYALARELEAMPDEQAQAVVKQLLGPENRPPTRVTMAWQTGSPLPAPAQQGAPTEIPNTVRNEFKKLLQEKINNQNDLTKALIESGLADETEASAVSGLSADELMSPQHAPLLLSMIRKDTDLQDMLVRQAALNRARELVLLEIARDPRMEKKIAGDEPVLFTSISLLTPDSLRHHLSKFAGGTSFDEREMLEIQLKAWSDLDNEIKQGGVVINGRPLKAEFCPFNFGVSDMAVLGPGSDPVIGEVISGHDFANRSCNEKSLNAMVGLRDAHGAVEENNHTDQAIQRMQEELNSLSDRHPRPEGLDKRIKQLEYDLQVVKQLQEQIRQIWEDGSYRRAGNEPYKLVSRIALLSFLIEGGTLFNCKSGKDRTGQLSVEAKFLALRIKAGNGLVPTPDNKCSPWEHVQYGCLLFFDKARTRMQKYATGYEGSKLSYAKRVFAYFSQAFSELPKSERIRTAEAQVREFIGLSSRTKF